MDYQERPEGQQIPVEHIPTEGQPVPVVVQPAQSEQSPEQQPEDDSRTRQEAIAQVQHVLAPTPEPGGPTEEITHEQAIETGGLSLEHASELAQRTGNFAALERDFTGNELGQ